MEKKSKKPLNFDKRIYLRVSEGELEIITAYAKKNNLTISDILRSYINTLAKD